MQYGVYQLAKLCCFLVKLHVVIETDVQNFVLPNRESSFFAYTADECFAAKVRCLSTVEKESKLYQFRFTSVNNFSDVNV